MLKLLCSLLLALVALATPLRAPASEVVTATGAGALLMPWNVELNRTSFAIVTRVDHDPRVVASHWTFWAEDCRHLVDVTVCLTPRDTKVMDPRNVQNETQDPLGFENIQAGPITDLTGEAGLLTVTAFVRDPNAPGCRATTEIVPGALVGGWTIADTSSGAGFGNDAWGLVRGDRLPPVAEMQPILIQAFAPESLESGFGIALAVQERQGHDRFADVELGPIATDPVCCNVVYVDNLEIETSLPDVCFLHAGFAPIRIEFGEDDEFSFPLIPGNTTIEAPGHARLTNCTVGAGTDARSLEDGEFVFVALAQGVGPYGVATSAVYTRQAVVIAPPLPSPTAVVTPTSTPTPQPTSSPPDFGG